MKCSGKSRGYGQVAPPIYIIFPGTYSKLTNEKEEPKFYQ